VPAIIEDARFPIRVKTLTGVGVFIQMAAIKVRKSMLVVGEMGWHPIQYHTYALTVEIINQIHQVLRAAIPAGGRKIIADLITPRTIKGVLRDRQKLDMRKTKAVHMVGKQRRHLAVVQPAIAFFGPSFPRAKMNLIDGNRCILRDASATVRHPFLIVPMVRKIAKRGCCAWGKLHGKGVGVRLGYLVATMVGNNVVFVKPAIPKPGNETNPDARPADGMQRMSAGGPVIEISNYAYRIRIRCPNSKVKTRFSMKLERVGAQLFIQPGMIAFIEEVQVQRTQ